MSEFFLFLETQENTLFGNRERLLKEWWNEDKIKTQSVVRTSRQTVRLCYFAPYCLPFTIACILYTKQSKALDIFLIIFFLKKKCLKVSQSVLMFFQGGLGEQRWPGEETSFHSWGRGEWRRAALCVKGTSLTSASYKGAKLTPALTPPSSKALSSPLWSQSPCHASDTCGLLQQCPSRAQP